MLIRFKWMEILTRLANRKHFKSGEIPNVEDAISHMFGTFLFVISPHLKQKKTAWKFSTNIPFTSRNGEIAAFGMRSATQF